jgi:hypothetical protein
MKKYLVLFFASITLLSSCKVEDLLNPAVIVTKKPTDITGSSVTLHGNLVSLSTTGTGTANAERGFIYTNLSMTPTLQDNKIAVGSGLGEYSYLLQNLKPNTTYYYMAYSLNSNNSPSFGMVETFKTTDLKVPTATKVDVTKLGLTSATFTSSISDDGGAAITERGFVYATTANPTTAKTKVTSGSGKGEFTAVVTNLVKATTYYIRSYAINSKGTSYGIESSFTTPTNYALTTTFTDVAAMPSPLAVSGKLTGAGTSPAKEYGVLYGVSQNLTTANSTNVNTNGSAPGFNPANQGGYVIPSLNNAKIISPVKSDGSFDVIIQYLVGAKVYYARSYVVLESNEVIYGNVVTIPARTYVRDPARFDVANVYYKSAYALFDLLTDEVITPNVSGTYDIWYSSNEDPKPYSRTFTKAQMTSFLFYKFKNKENCQRWCDLKTGVIKP